MTRSVATSATKPITQTRTSAYLRGEVMSVQTSIHVCVCTSPSSFLSTHSTGQIHTIPGHSPEMKGMLHLSSRRRSIPLMRNSGLVSYNGDSSPSPPRASPPRESSAGRSIAERETSHRESQSSFGAGPSVSPFTHREERWVTLRPLLSSTRAPPATSDLRPPTLALDSCCSSIRLPCDLSKDGD